MLAEKVDLPSDSVAETFACVLLRRHPKLSESVRAISCVFSPYINGRASIRNLSTIISFATKLRELEIKSFTPMHASHILSAVQDNAVIIRLRIQPAPGPRMLEIPRMLDAPWKLDAPDPRMLDAERSATSDGPANIVTPLIRFTSLQSLVFLLDDAEFSSAPPCDALPRLMELSISCSCNSLFRWLANCRYGVFLFQLEDAEQL